MPQVRHRPLVLGPPDPPCRPPGAGDAAAQPAGDLWAAALLRGAAGAPVHLAGACSAHHRRRRQPVCHRPGLRWAGRWGRLPTHVAAKHPALQLWYPQAPLRLTGAVHSQLVSAAATSTCIAAPERPADCSPRGPGPSRPDTVCSPRHQPGWRLDQAQGAQAAAGRQRAEVWRQHPRVPGGQAAAAACQALMAGLQPSSAERRRVLLLMLMLHLLQFVARMSTLWPCNVDVWLNEVNASVLGLVERSGAEDEHCDQCNTCSSSQVPAAPLWRWCAACDFAPAPCTFRFLEHTSSV